MITTNLLPLNPLSRPGTTISPTGIVMHWVANAGTSAEFNRNYFATRKEGFGSAHYIVDLDGSIIQCLPNEEVGYHVGAKVYTRYADFYFGSYPNNCTIGIELCHPDKTGKPTPETEGAAIELASNLCRLYGINPEDRVCRHFDITTKQCPLWYCTHLGDWFRFKERVKGLL